MQLVVQHSAPAVDVCVPASLLMAPLPSWVKMVWMSIRQHQGRGDSCTASYAEIGELCINSNGNPTDKSNVGKAVQMLMEEGLLYRKNDAEMVCTGGSVVERTTVVENTTAGVVECTTDSPKQCTPVVEDTTDAPKSDSTAGGDYRGGLIKVLSKSENGMEKGESEGEKPRSRKPSRIDDLELDERLLEYAAEKAPLVDAALEFEKFNNWLRAKGRRYKDYRRAFQNWLIKAQEFAQERAPKKERVKVNLTQPVSAADMMTAIESLPVNRSDFFEKGYDWKGDPQFMLMIEKRRELNL